MWCRVPLPTAVPASCVCWQHGALWKLCMTCIDIMRATAVWRTRRGKTLLVPSLLVTGALLLNLILCLASSHHPYAGASYLRNMSNRMWSLDFLSRRGSSQLGEEEAPSPAKKWVSACRSNCYVYNDMLMSMHFHSSGVHRKEAAQSRQQQQH